MSDYMYTEDHLWIRDEGGGEATIGITDFAQGQLEEIVHVELPDPGSRIVQHEDIGVVESTKTTAELRAPASGDVRELNERLIEEPDLLNRDPMGEGWLLRIALAVPSELEDLLFEGEYQNLVAPQH